MPVPPVVPALEQPTDSPIGQRAMAGAVYLVGREGIGMIIRLLGAVAVVREMGPSAYGIYIAAAAYVMVASSVAQMGIEVFLIRSTEEPDRHQYNQAFTYLLVTSLAITVTALVATFAFASEVRPRGVLLPLRVLLLAVPINVLWAPAQACIERRFGYRQMGILEVVGDLALYVTAVPLALAGAGAWSLVAGYFAWQVWLLVGSLAMSGLRPRWEWSGETMRALTRHGLSFSSSTWLTRLAGLVNPLVVGTLVGSAGVGYVAFAQRLVDTVGFARRGAYRLGMVAMSKVPVGDRQRLRYGVEEGSLLQLVALAVPFAIFGLVARWVVPAVFGPKWTRAIPVFSMLAVAAILAGPALIQITMLYSRGKNRDVAVATIAQVGVLAASAVVLVHWFGLIGFGAASLVALAGLVVVDRMVRRITEFSYRALVPFTVALVPIVLFPVVPLRTGPFLFIPLVVIACIPAARADGLRIVRLVRMSLQKVRG